MEAGSNLTMRGAISNVIKTNLPEQYLLVSDAEGKITGSSYSVKNRENKI